MIDIIKSIDGQNNSARFFLYEKLNLSTFPVFSFFMISMMLISISDSLYFLFLWLTLLLTASLCLRSFFELSLKPFITFKLFLLFSFGFSYISSFDVKMSCIFLLKIYLLISLGLFFNYFTDFKLLINNLDCHLSRISPVYLRKAFRKSLFSIMLGIEFMKDLICGSKNIISEKSGRTAKLSAFGKNTAILADLFVFSFGQASAMEDFYSSGQADFDTKRKLPALFVKYDMIVYLLTAIIFTLFLEIK